jgi:hypothetical protein
MLIATDDATIELESMLELKSMTTNNANEDKSGGHVDCKGKEVPIPLVDVGKSTLPMSPLYQSAPVLRLTTPCGQSKAKEMLVEAVLLRDEEEGEEVVGS